MDLTKFLDFLNSESLFFARSDKFDDIFEGSFPKGTIEQRNKRFQTEADNKNLKSPQSTEFWQERGIKVKKDHAINCWHMNDHESAAMWKLYLQSREGIAIQSTYSRLVESLSSAPEKIFVGAVDYIDYDKDVIGWGNVLIPYVHKRKSFEHEKELRAIIWKSQLHNSEIVNLDNGGTRIKTDVKTLVESVYVSPDSPIWLTDLIKDTCNKFGFDFDVINSRLNDSPIF